MSGNVLSDAVHRALYGVALASAATAPALAQEEIPEALEEIVTTGTRIPVDANLVASSPVTTVDASELTFTGVARVEDLVNDMPQLVPELTATDSNGSTGTATLDLRGLGSARTLVLVNGHRMGFGDPTVPSPDINQIPGNLVERVEILTGGASSTYGSDAVSGVVNFIMKSDFEGFAFDYQISGYRHDNDNGAAQAAIDAAGFEQAPSNPTDGEMRNYNVVIGVNSPDGRGNVTGYVGYRDIKAVRHSERDYSACALGGENPPIGDCRGSSTIPTASFRDFAATNPIDLTLDLATGDFIPRAGLAYNYGPPNYFQRPDERYTGGVFGHYEIQPGFEGYAEFMFMDDRSLAQIAPSGTFFNNTNLNCDNPLMSNQQLAAIGCPGGVPSAATVPIYVGKRNVEGGPRFDDLKHNSNRMLVGFRGDIGENWGFDVYFNTSRLRYSEVYNNDLSITNIIRALDVITDPSTGQPACRSFVSGDDPNCVPYNVFQPNGVTQAALSYIDLPLYSTADLEMDVGVGYITGDLTDYGVVLPTAEDGVNVVLGFQYGDENFVYDLDQNYNSGNAAGQGGATADVSGAILRKEWFAEARVPLVQDRPGFQDLSLDMRYRYSDYDIGIDANTYSFGVAYSPVDALKVRASFNRAVRAPNITELFQPQTIGLWQGTDPCAGATPSLTEAQCALTGVPAGAYGGVPANPADQYNGLFGGNPNLDEETSDSITVGFLLTPEGVLDGLTLSVDYWNIEVEDAISTVDPEFIINQCGMTGDATFCGLIRRSPANGNVWVGSGPNAPRVSATNVNIGFFEVEGIDINGTYSFEVGDHAIDLSLRGTVLSKWDDQPQPGSDINDCVGKWGGACGRPRPEWKHVASARWGTPIQGLSFNGAWRYISSMDEFERSRFNPGSASYFDLAGQYSFDLAGGTAQITAGINNVLDEEPEFHGLLNTAPYSNANTIPGTWDPLGQYWFLGVNYTMGE